MHFIETPPFTRRHIEFLSGDELRLLQNVLAESPEIGDVIPGCGGVRKMRWRDEERGKGKRGGCRVLYLSVEQAECIYLLMIYGKDKKEDLTADEKRILTHLAERIREESTKGM